mmetsp:Transcript_95315/g.169221  ORF Transcript_95315/g.169221 Transcript_95315/m.169221 type:complete len:210 (-) Transcript_95315:2205-2834(-)
MASAVGHSSSFKCTSWMIPCLRSTAPIVNREAMLAPRSWQLALHTKKIETSSRTRACSPTQLPMLRSPATSRLMVTLSSCGTLELRIGCCHSTERLWPFQKRPHRLLRSTNGSFAVRATIHLFQACSSRPLSLLLSKQSPGHSRCKKRFLPKSRISSSQTTLWTSFFYSLEGTRKLLSFQAVGCDLRRPLAAVLRAWRSEPMMANVGTR